jgi:hypothetical protein
MRLFLQLAALAVAFVVTVFWFFGGPDFGWTKTTVAITGTDPVTDQEYVRWEKRFVPGVDFLALGWGAALILAGGALCFKRKVR